MRDTSYLSPALDGEWLEDSDTGGGNSVGSSCTGPGERYPGLGGREAGKNLGIQNKG